MCELDGTKNKVTLGANSILGVSLANAHAMASNNRQPLFEYINRADHLALQKSSLAIAFVIFAILITDWVEYRVVQK